jgi:uncharacterized protein
MGIYEDVNQQLKDAMKAQDKARLQGLRMIRAAFIEEMKKNAAQTVPDDRAVELLRRLQKQRNDSIEAYAQGGRQDLVAVEQAELQVIETFLPKLADEGALRSWVEEAIAATGATTKGNVGQVMGHLMKNHKGMVDGKRAKEIAESLLA